VAQGGGFEKLTGTKGAFLDADLGMIDLDVLRTLPKGSVFQVTEREGLDKDVIIKSGVLRKQNYQIAGGTFGARNGCFYPFISGRFRADRCVLPRPDQLVSTAALFEKLPVKLAAFNVQDVGVFDRCEKLGFELSRVRFLSDPRKGPRRFPRRRLFSCNSQTISGKQGRLPHREALQEQPETHLRPSQAYKLCVLRRCPEGDVIRHAITLWDMRIFRSGLSFSSSP